MTFGMAFSRIGMPVAEIRDYLDFSGFNALELPWEVFFNPDSTADTLYKEICRRNRTGKQERHILFDKDIRRSLKDPAHIIARGFVFQEIFQRTIQRGSTDIPGCKELKSPRKLQ